MSDRDLVSVQVEVRGSLPEPVLGWLQAALSGAPVEAEFSVEVFDGDALESAASLLGLPHTRLERWEDGWLLSVQGVVHDDLRPGLFALLLAVAPWSADGLAATSRVALGDSIWPELFYVQDGVLFVGVPSDVPVAVVADPAAAPAWEDRSR